MRHKVMCEVCGKKEVIEVERGKKIKNRNWYYFGKSDLNSIKRSKYLYEVIALRPNLKTKKVPNEGYDKRAKPKIVEQWECAECWNVSKDKAA